MKKKPKPEEGEENKIRDKRRAKTKNGSAKMKQFT